MRLRLMLGTRVRRRRREGRRRWLTGKVTGDAAGLPRKWRMTRTKWTECWDDHLCHRWRRRNPTGTRGGVVAFSDSPPRPPRGLWRWCPPHSLRSLPWRPAVWAQAVVCACVQPVVDVDVLVAAVVLVVAAVERRSQLPRRPSAYQPP